MNYDKITPKMFDNIEKLIELNRRQNELYGEMRLSLMHKVITEKLAELEVKTKKVRAHAVPVGAKLVWPVTTNHVGETIQPEYLLTWDEFMRLAPRRYIANTSYEQRISKHQWNKCYGISITGEK